MILWYLLEGRGFPIVLDLKLSSFEEAEVWNDVSSVFVKIAWRMNAVKSLLVRDILHQPEDGKVLRNWWPL